MESNRSESQREETTGHGSAEEPAVQEWQPSTAPPTAGLPVLVIGAGPVGLAAATHLRSRGLDVVVLEAGPRVGENVREWGHVPLFSPWRYLVDRQVRTLLLEHGWSEPGGSHHPTGTELVERLLEPLAAHPAIAPTLRLEHRVTAVTRQGLDRAKTSGRDELPFLVVAATPLGEVRMPARAVIDASGTWQQPNPLGAGGVPAAGEEAHGDRIRYGIPDVLGVDRAEYAGKRVLVVGSGHSAFHAVLSLVELAEGAPGTEVTWAVRRERPGQMFGGGDDDALEERGALGTRVSAAIARAAVDFVTGFRLDRLEREGQLVRVTADDGRSLLADRIVAATGFRPDVAMTRELRLELDPTTEAPVRLAPLIDPNVHSCGTVPPHGEAELAHPEPGFYALGMKSYGRAPTFLMLTGYEQVRSVVAHLAGDHVAARQVELELPATGACCTSGGEEAPQGSQAPHGSRSAASAAEELRVVAGGCC